MNQKWNRNTSKQVLTPKCGRRMARVQHSLRVLPMVNEGSDHLPDSGKVRRGTTATSPWWALPSWMRQEPEPPYTVTTCWVDSTSGQKTWSCGWGVGSFSKLPQSTHRWGNLRPRRWKSTMGSNESPSACSMPRSLQGTVCPLPLTRFIPADLDLQDAAEPAARFPPRLSWNPQSLAIRLQSPQLPVLPLITPSNSIFLGLFLSLSCNPFKSTDGLVLVDHQPQYSGSGRSCGEHAPSGEGMGGCGQCSQGGIYLH